MPTARLLGAVLFFDFRVLKAKLFQSRPAIGCIQRTPENGDVSAPAHLGTGPLDIRLLDMEAAIRIQKATPSLHQISSHAAASQKAHEGQEGLSSWTPHQRVECRDPSQYGCVHKNGVGR